MNMSVDSTAAATADLIHRIANDETTEHISLGDDFAVLAGVEEPEQITERIEYTSRLRGMRTQLIFYAEGYLRVRQWRRKKKIRDYMLSLRFLGTDTQTVRNIPMRVLHVAGASAGFATFCGALAYLTPWKAGFAIAAGVGGITAMGAVLTFLYLAQEKTRFATAAGRCGVLTLLGTFDTFKRCRSIVPEIVSAIEAAHVKNVQSRSDYLRQEMREHYRLREYGVIDQEICSEATRRLLAQFG
jgi:hypothetical protein